MYAILNKYVITYVNLKAYTLMSCAMPTIWHKG
jgi:hypothetical protein